LFKTIIIHLRIHQRRPEIEDEDVITAWMNAFVVRERTDSSPGAVRYLAAAGLDRKNRLLEMIGVETEDDGVVIYHAMKLTDKMKTELGLL